MKKVLLICCFFAALATAALAQPHAAKDPMEKAKGLQKQLKLSDAQTKQVAAIYEDSAQKFAEIKKKENGNTDKMLADVGPLRTSTINKIKGVLTPSQAKEYDKLLSSTSNSGLNSGWGDGWSSSAGS